MDPKNRRTNLVKWSIEHPRRPTEIRWKMFRRVKATSTAWIQLWYWTTWQTTQPGSSLIHFYDLHHVFASIASCVLLVMITFFYINYYYYHWCWLLLLWIAVYWPLLSLISLYDQYHVTIYIYIIPSEDRIDSPSHTGFKLCEIIFVMHGLWIVTWLIHHHYSIMWNNYMDYGLLHDSTDSTITIIWVQ